MEPLLTPDVPLDNVIEESENPEQWDVGAAQNISRLIQLV